MHPNIPFSGYRHVARIMFGAGVWRRYECIWHECREATSASKLTYGGLGHRAPQHARHSLADFGLHRVLDGDRTSCTRLRCGCTRTFVSFRLLVAGSKQLDCAGATAPTRLQAGIKGQAARTHMQL